MLSLKLLYKSPIASFLRGRKKVRKKEQEVLPAAEEEGLDLNPLRARYVRSVPEAQMFRGVLLQGYLVPPNILERLDEMEIRQDDVFIITYPKSGTTWTEEIVSLICKGGDVRQVERELLIYRVHHLEVGRPFGHLRFLRKLKSPRLMATHLPLPLLPKQLRHAPCKVIYVMRNPKDTCVSYYHHHKMSTFLGNSPFTWDEWLLHFTAGHVAYGSWFDHVLPYWEFCKMHPNNVLFLTYEELKLDLHTMVIKISEFLEKPLTEDAVDTIVQHCTFESMKNNKMVNREKLPISDLFDMSQSKFMRKGIIGDWKNHFTEDQSDRFEEICHSRMAGNDLQLVFEEEEAAKLYAEYGRIIHNHPERTLPLVEYEPEEKRVTDPLADIEVTPFQNWTPPFFQIYLQSDPLTVYANE